MVEYQPPERDANWRREPITARETHALLGTVEGPVEVRDRAETEGVSAAKAAE